MMQLHDTPNKAGAVHFFKLLITTTKQNLMKLTLLETPHKCCQLQQPRSTPISWCCGHPSRVLEPLRVCCVYY